jgi:NAD(P)-dependent dehydrogenase (short-subunit alcohol dehydrogenase family)
MFRINVFGVHNCHSTAAKQLVKQGTCTLESPGKLLAAASIVAFKPFPLLSHYSASKYAVRGLTSSYAMELASEHITVNAYAPGIVGTVSIKRPTRLTDEKIQEQPKLTSSTTRRQCGT